MTTPAPGSWPSPLSAEAATTASTAFRNVAHGPGGEVWWAEQRPEEGGRTVLLSRSGDDRPVVRVPAGFDARTAFHEYGGLCWTPLAGGTVVSSSMPDQRLWLLGDGEPRALTPDSEGQHRYCLPSGCVAGCCACARSSRPGSRGRPATSWCSSPTAAATSSCCGTAATSSTRRGSRRTARRSRS